MHGTLRFLVDMNVSPLTVEFLQSLGYDAIRVPSVLHSTTPDDILLEYARNEGYCILTNDLDFSALIALNNYTRPSVLTLRLPVMEIEDIHTLLQRALPTFVVAVAERSIMATLTDSSLRIRALPIH
jgi:predicted nuclease of predicted toxin-antitoxin system